MNRCRLQKWSLTNEGFSNYRGRTPVVINYHPIISWVIILYFGAKTAKTAHSSATWVPNENSDYNSKKVILNQSFFIFKIFECDVQGYMNWTHVPRTESCHNVTVSDYKKVYQFAISANSQSLPRNSFSSLYKPTSSGMVWASCTVMHNTGTEINGFITHWIKSNIMLVYLYYFYIFLVVGKIKNVWVNIIGSTFMELRWKLDCSDRINSVLGFRIFYCPVVSINNSACKGKIYLTIHF